MFIPTFACTCFFRSVNAKIAKFLLVLEFGKSPYPLSPVKAETLKFRRHGQETDWGYDNCKEGVLCVLWGRNTGLADKVKCWDTEKRKMERLSAMS